MFDHNQCLLHTTPTFLCTFKRCCYCRQGEVEPGLTMFQFNRWSFCAHHISSQSVLPLSLSMCDGYNLCFIKCKHETINRQWSPTTGYYVSSKHLVSSSKLDWTWFNGLHTNYRDYLMELPFTKLFRCTIWRGFSLLCNLHELLFLHWLVWSDISYLPSVWVLM